MNTGGPREGFGRLVLKALAVASALTFLAIVMVNACATYAGSTKASPVVTRQAPQPAVAPATAQDAKPPAEKPKPPPEPRLLAPATKSVTVVPPRPLLQLPPPEQGAPPEPQQRGAR